MVGKTKHSYKIWKKVTSPNKLVWFFQILTARISGILLVLAAIPEAKVVYLISTASYREAKKWLLITLAITALSVIFKHINYLLDTKQLKTVYNGIQNNIFEKVFNVSEDSLKNNSKEKMINTITNDIAVLSDFCDRTATKTSYFIEALITIIVIFTYDLLLGFTILGTSILVFVMFKLLNKSIANKSNVLYTQRDLLSETFADLYDKRALSTDLNLKSSLKERYFDKVKDILKTYGSRTVLKSLRDNFVYIFYTLIIFVLTLYLVDKVQANLVTATAYFVLTPYLTLAITKMADFFSLSYDLETASISALRVKTLLDMSEKDLIDFGNNETERVSGSLTFTNVSYLSSSEENTAGSVKKFSANILRGECALIQGERHSGKRAIFYMLRRELRPQTGTITLDTINIYDFSSEAYKGNISYLTSRPDFYQGTILDNLKMVEKNRNKIFAACKKVGIHDKIQSLENGYNTLLLKNLDELKIEEKFLLSLARVLLTNASVIMIYELPAGLTDEEIEPIKKALKALKKEKTIIIFSANNDIPEIIDRHFYIENKTLKEPIKNAKHSKTTIKVDSPFSK